MCVCRGSEDDSEFSPFRRGKKDIAGSQRSVAAVSSRPHKKDTHARKDRTCYIAQIMQLYMIKR